MPVLVHVRQKLKCREGEVKPMDNFWTCVSDTSSSAKRSRASLTRSLEVVSSQFWRENEIYRLHGSFRSMIPGHCDFEDESCGLGIMNRSMECMPLSFRLITKAHHPIFTALSHEQLLPYRKRRNQMQREQPPKNSRSQRLETANDLSIQESLWWLPWARSLNSV